MLPILDDIMGVDEAAELWGLSAGYIKNLCAETKIIAKKIGNVWVIDKRQPNPSKKVFIREKSYEEVKRKFREWVDSFLSQEPGIEKKELLPNFWTVTSKKHDLYLTIQCEYHVRDLRTMEKDWFAVVTDTKTKEKSNYQLEFTEDELTVNTMGLTDEQYELFIKVHNAHLQAMGTENQKKYALENVKEVIWDSEEDCLKVYYDDTWWHYLKNCTWY